MKAKFSKRHYVTIAKALQDQINGHTHPDHRVTLQGFAKSLAKTFANDNVKFDESKFLAAVNAA